MLRRPSCRMARYHGTRRHARGSGARNSARSGRRAPSRRRKGYQTASARLGACLLNTQLATALMSSVVKIDPEIMSGAPCFSGTRVTIQTLIDHLEAGDSIEDFLDGFPSVSREQVVAFLEANL